MRTARLLIGVAGAAVVVLGLRTTAAQIDPRMPDGPNRELVVRKCTTCHDLGNIVGTGGRSREGWNGKIEEMETYGMRVTAEERAFILDYLATYLPR